MFLNKLASHLNVRHYFLTKSPLKKFYIIKKNNHLKVNFYLELHRYIFESLS